MRFLTQWMGNPLPESKIALGKNLSVNYLHRTAQLRFRCAGDCSVQLS